MFQYKKYLVKETDQFNPQQFSFVMDEMAIIREQTEHVSSLLRDRILVSYLKGRAIESEWKEANPELTALVISGSLQTNNIATLFECSRNNTSFSQQMEAYLMKGFSE